MQRKTRVRGWIGLLVAALLGGATAPAGAEEARAGEEARGDERFRRGQLHLGLSGGWGQGFEWRQPQDEVRMIAVVPHLGVGVTDEIGRSWYRGNLDLTLEPQLLANLHPTGGFAGGAALAVRYHFLAGRRWVPFLAGGAGMLDLDFDGRHQDDGFNFILQGGAGAHFPLAERTTLTLDLRWHHISNADLRSPNNGIDSAMLLVGLTWFPR